MPPIVPEDENSTIDIESFPLKIGTAEGNTGLDINLSMPWNEDDIIAYLKIVDYGQYIPTIWDCEDRSFWGVAHVRHRFSGCPIGVASGKAKRNGKEVQHAVIILWCPDEHGKISESSRYIYFDPDTKGVISEASFTPELIVPFSVDKTRSKQTIPPLNGAGFEKPLNNVYFIFDYHHEWSFDINKIIQYVIEQEHLKFSEKYRSGCEELAVGGQGTQEVHKVIDKIAASSLWSKEDRALWAFAHVRRKFKGFPIGMALSNDDAVLILWENPNKAVYLHPKDGIIANFNPRLVWV
ncbi:MAG: hypothetical protein PHQ34_03940 [Methanothrix sp.]|nr:hypothetical protein [Methanothrix sp.]